MAPHPRQHRHIQHPNEEHGPRPKVIPYPTPGEKGEWSGHVIQQNPATPHEPLPAGFQGEALQPLGPVDATSVIQTALTYSPFIPRNPYPPFTQNGSQAHAIRR